MAEIAPLDEQILSLFVSSAERLQALVRDLSETDLDILSEANGWTIRQIIHHVADDCGETGQCRRGDRRANDRSGNGEHAGRTHA